MHDLRSDPEFISAGIRVEAERLAAGGQSFSQRAAVHHHLYAHSLGNFAFPLLAAHGSLWAGRYLKRIARGGEVLKWEHLSAPRRQERVRTLRAFIDMICEIDRRVCVETYYLYRLTQHRATRSHGEGTLPAALFEQLDRCHSARRAQRRLTDGEKRAFFSTFLEWQDERVVAPIVEARSGDADWRWVGKMPLQPQPRLPYFARRDALPLSGLLKDDARLGLASRAFDLAEQAGWEKVESSLGSNRQMPLPFRRNAGQHFFAIQNHARRVLRQEFLAAC